MVSNCPHCNDDISHLSNDGYKLHIEYACYMLNLTANQKEQIKQKEKNPINMEYWEKRSRKKLIEGI